MSADATTAIGPVSVRYAAQIRELLYAQAVHRMAADQEAARASAQAERQPAPEPIKAKIDAPQPAKAPDTQSEPTPATTAPAHLVDIQA